MSTRALAIALLGLATLACGDEKDAPKQAPTTAADSNAKPAADTAEEAPAAKPLSLIHI